MKLKSLFVVNLLTVLFLSVFVFGVSAQKKTPNTKRKSKSKVITTKIPQVQKLDIEGLKKLLQRDPKNARPLLVNFWATWCDPCREEFPDLVKIDNEYRPKGLDFVTVSLDDLADIKTGVPQFLKEMKATMPAYLLHVEDQSEAIEAVSPTWGGGLPATFLFDAQGQIVYSKTGIVKLDLLKEEINKVLPSK
jgi:thiol-disulfide isomerase/thioredoxin